MAASDSDPEALMEGSHRGWGEFVKGDPEPAKEFFTRRDDLTLGNPFGPFVTGWKQAEETMNRAASLYRDGEVTGFERVATYSTPDLVCVVEVERYRTKVGGSDDVASVALRVTSLLRREEDGWKIVHRHADPITSARSPDSVVER